MRPPRVPARASGTRMTERELRPYLIGVGLAILIAGVAAFVIFHPDRLCEARDGKWSIATNSCITRACYTDHTCEKRANPYLWCNRLRVNDPISEVYFQFGEPDGIEHGKYRWRAAKMSALNIVATFSQDRLSSLAIEADADLPQDAEPVPRACILSPQPRDTVKKAITPTAQTERQSEP